MVWLFSQAVIWFLFFFDPVLFSRSLYYIRGRVSPASESREGIFYSGPFVAKKEGDTIMELLAPGFGGILHSLADFPFLFYLCFYLPWQLIWCKSTKYSHGFLPKSKVQI